jgi:hypothetical protein
MTVTRKVRPKSDEMSGRLLESRVRNGAMLRDDYGLGLGMS